MSDLLNTDSSLPTESDEKLLDIILYRNYTFFYCTKTNQDILFCALKFIKEGLNYKKKELQVCTFSGTTAQCLEQRAQSNNLTQPMNAVDSSPTRDRGYKFASSTSKKQFIKIFAILNKGKNKTIYVYFIKQKLFGYSPSFA